MLAGAGHADRPYLLRAVGMPAGGRSPEAEGRPSGDLSGEWEVRVAEGSATGHTGVFLCGGCLTVWEEASDSGEKGRRTVPSHCQPLVG